MSFDSSRFTFNSWNDFSGVVMPQGRVQLDSDWNEWLAETARRIRAGTYDTLGPAVYPSTTPNAFLITPTGSAVSIGVGRMYVAGLLVENHGLPTPNSGGWIPPAVTASATQPAWDPALDELVGTNPIDYTQQPYYPNVTTIAPFPTTGGPFLIYLDVWLREITFLEYPDLIEKAVGVDTAGRLQTVWQVKWLDVSSAGSVTCTTPDSGIAPWESLIQPSAGRLTTGLVQSTPSGPCCLAPNTGYTGLENQLYRVEIHQPGTASSAPTGTFKWSNNNASVATQVIGIAPGQTVLTVQSTMKDSVLRFSANDWVEITDDWLELNGLQGELHQVSLVTDSANTIQLATPVSATSFPVDANNLTNPARHTRLIRWDQQGKVYKSDGTTVWTDLGAAGATGDIPIPPPGTAIILENGITVSFDLNPSTGEFYVGDYWNFAARTIDGTVENLTEAPPRGIHHHYARLAMLTLPSSATDCRVEWPPSGGEGGCDCASCVTAVSHNSGSWTIQNAVDAVQAQGGGKVCLGPGVYNIASAITISGSNQPAQGLAICGHALPTLQPTSSFQDDSIMLIEDAIDIEVDGIAFAGGASAATAAGAVINLAGLIVSTSTYVRVEGCSFGLATDTAQLSPAIGFGGTMLMDCTIRGNLFSNVELGITLIAITDRSLLTQLEIEDNQMYCTDGAVFLSLRELFVSGIRFANNFVQSTSGFVLSGQGTGVNIEDNTFSIAAATPTTGDPYDAAIVCNISVTRIANNVISIDSNTLTAAISGNQGLPAGTYVWVVTALDVSGRETLITSTATLTLTTAASVSLEWAPVVGATSYNVYRTVANSTSNTLLLDANVPPGSGTTVSYTDATPDSSLQNQIPTMQNDGIMLGSTTADSLMFGTQVIGNRIGDLIGSGITSPSTAALDTTIISQNQMLGLGGNGIVLSGLVTDIDIVQNSLASIALLAPPGKIAVGIQLQAAYRANLSENRIEQLGPATLMEGSRRAIYIVVATDTRISGNRIVDVAPTQTPSMGIYARVISRMDVIDNDVRRATTTPTKLDQSIWYALDAIGQTISVQGNLFESYAGNSQEPGTVAIEASLSCTFSNNQCFLNDPNGDDSPALVVEISAPSIIAMGNLVQGPTGGLPTMAPASMILNLPSGTKVPPVTVIGNITSMGITVLPGPMPAAMVPLNITA